MRWIAKHSVPNAEGDERMIEKFLWFPKTLEIGVDLYQTRWLEKCKIRQVYVADIYFDGYDTQDCSNWEDSRWAD
jgi:hypothetical protein